MEMGKDCGVGSGGNSPFLLSRVRRRYYGIPLPAGEGREILLNWRSAPPAPILSQRWTNDRGSSGGNQQGWAG